MFFYWLIPQHDSYISLVLGTYPTIGTPLLPCTVFSLYLPYYVGLENWSPTEVFKVFQEAVSRSCLLHSEVPPSQCPAQPVSGVMDDTSLVPMCLGTRLGSH